jgi:hypothetical protein
MHIAKMKYFLCCCLGLPAATFFLFTTGCDKDDDVNNNEPAIFAAKYNDTAWRPTSFLATYYRNLQVLYIRATDNTRSFRAAFLVGVAQPLKTYELEPLGNDIALFGNFNVTAFYSDINLPDAGGNFKLEKFDTTAGILTGKFLLKGYSEDRTLSATFSTDTMQNIPLVVKDTAFFGVNRAVPAANVKATLKGVNTVDWTMVDYFFRWHCGGPGTPATKYEILLCSVMGQGPVGRHIRFDINNKITPGTYPIVAQPNSSCDMTVNAKLFTHNPDNCYYPVSGQINIIQIDTLAHKLKATFSMVVRDTSSRQETIEITNGAFDLNGTW